MYIRMFVAWSLLLQCLACGQSPDLLTAAAGMACVDQSNNARPVAETRTTAADIVFQSVDGGTHWEDISGGLPDKLNVGPALALSENEVLLGTNQGMYRSVPPLAAPAWQKEFVLDFLPGEEMWSVCAGKNAPYAIRYGMGFFQHVPGSDTWRPVFIGLPDKNVRNILEVSDNNIIVSCNSGIYQSTDAGKRWKHVYADNVVSELYAEDGLLFAMTYPGVLRSVDGGEHWDWYHKRNGDHAMMTRMDGKLMLLSYQGGAWKQILLGNAAAEIGSDRATSEFLESISGFVNVSEVTQMGQYLFCSHREGLSRSTDKGKTWELIFPAIGDNKVLHVLTAGNSVFVIQSFGC